MKTIGQIIFEKRTNRKWSRQTLGNKVGVTHVTVRNWEKNRFFPNAICCIALAEAFGCTIDELCGVTH